MTVKRAMDERDIDPTYGGKIPQEKYNYILENIPVSCVDIVFVNLYENTVLLVKRNEEPKKDCYWFPGGRVMKGERRENAAFRILKEECGINSKEYHGFLHELHTMDTIFDAPEDLKFGKIVVHTINSVFLFLPTKEMLSTFDAIEADTFEINTDKTISGHHWYPLYDMPMGKLLMPLDPYITESIDKVRQFLNTSKIF